MFLGGPPPLNSPYHWASGVSLDTGAFPLSNRPIFPDSCLCSNEFISLPALSYHLAADIRQTASAPSLLKGLPAPLEGHHSAISVSPALGDSGRQIALSGLEIGAADMSQRWQAIQKERLI